MTQNNPAIRSSGEKEARWKQAYGKTIGTDRTIRNRSGIEIEPLYGPNEPGADYIEKLGYPGQPPFTRGIYPTMHRGRTWTQRQLIGLGVPEDYNERLKSLLAAGATAASFIPCNSGFRGVDADTVDPLLLGTCGTVVNTVDDMDRAFQDIDLAEISLGLNDPSPFTLLAFILAVAKKRGVPWGKIRGTSNQSDYISHFVANHMFFRLALPGARRIFVDHVAFCNAHVPLWNPVSVVGQHMQQAGATPAQTMGFTLSTAFQFAEDCAARGLDPEKFLARFTFFFDISISFFEEVAKFRAGRRIWARELKRRFGIESENVMRFKFHGQTSGADLTYQQPLNNVTRVAVQAMAGIFGGLQSLHTDAYDEAISTPSEKAARIAINAQNILKDEAHLCDVIDPLGGSYYVEALTDRMEDEIVAVIDEIDTLGGMYAAVEAGHVQRAIGDSAEAFQSTVDDGAQKIVGVNAYQSDDEDTESHEALERPDPERIDAYLANLATFKQDRDQARADTALDDLARASDDTAANVFEKIVESASAGATHGEIVARLRDVYGFGHPLIVA